MGRRKRREERFGTASPNTSTPQAVEELHAVSMELRKVRARWPRINAVTAELRREMDENDFAGRFRTAMGG